MPRKARIDAPGALHHIIVRGISVGGYSQMIRTGIISLNAWVILLPRRKPVVLRGR